jgi:hypothetical protein
MKGGPKIRWKHGDFINNSNIYSGIHVPLYHGAWCGSKSMSYEVHKFWFCHDDFNHWVGNTERKYVMDRLIMPTIIWHVQEGNLSINIK